MKKTFKIENLDCAHCAAKMEELIKAIDGVEAAAVSFIKSAAVITAPDDFFEDIVAKAAKEIKRVDPDAELVY